MMLFTACYFDARRERANGFLHIGAMLADVVIILWTLRVI